MTTLTAVVPATNAPPTLRACLDAIAASDQPPEQVVVVSAGGGPADARNRGAQEATGDIVVFVDADVLPHADAFARIRRAFDDDPALAAVFGSYDDDPAEPDAVSSFRNLLHHHVHQTSPGPATTFWTGLGAVRRDVFVTARGFDADRYPLASVEDIDLGSRISRAGGRILLDPRIQGTHLKRWSLGSMARTDFSLRGLPWAELLLRDGTTRASLNLGWRHRASAAASLLATSAFVRARPARTLAWLGALAGLNLPFYALLMRRRGLGIAAVGLLLHAAHHVIGATAAAVAVARHVRRR